MHSGIITDNELVCASKTTIMFVLAALMSMFGNPAAMDNLNGCQMMSPE